MTEILATNVGFVEGPVWYDGQLWFTSVWDGVVKRLDGADPEVVFEVVGGANGLTVDADGTFYLANNGNHGQSTPCIQRLSSPVEVITDAVDGRGFRNCNDLCFGPDGWLYFTDSGEEYGDSKALHDAGQPPERPGLVCRVHPGTGETQLLDESLYFPNGIGFSPDGSRLYVTDTIQKAVMALPWSEGGVGAPEVFAQLDGVGGPDGFAVDVDGRLYVATTLSGDLRVYDRDGALEATHKWSEDSLVLNCCFGGPEHRTLFVTDAGGLEGQPGWSPDNERIVAIECGAPGLRLHDRPAP